MEAVLPRGVTGPHFLFACADYRNSLPETTETDNARGTTTAMQVSLPLPADLVVSAVSDLAAVTPGDTVTLTVWRDEKTRKVRVRLQAPQ